MFCLSLYPFLLFLLTLPVLTHSHSLYLSLSISFTAGTADNNWGFQFNLYRPALGELDLVEKSHDQKSEGDNYPDWLNPESAEENWRILSGDGKDTFDVFDRASGESVQGRFPSDPLVRVNENAVGDIPSGPLNGHERHESFIGSDSDVRKVKGGPVMKSLTWDTDMYENNMIKPQAKAVRYLKEEGVLEDCKNIKDREQQASCIAREKQSKEMRNFRFKDKKKENWEKQGFGMSPIFI